MLNLFWWWNFSRILHFTNERGHILTLHEALQQLLLFWIRETVAREIYISCHLSHSLSAIKQLDEWITILFCFVHDAQFHWNLMIYHLSGPAPTQKIYTEILLLLSTCKGPLGPSGVGCNSSQEWSSRCCTSIWTCCGIRSAHTCCFQQPTALTETSAVAGRTFEDQLDCIL